MPAWTPARIFYPFVILCWSFCEKFRPWQVELNPAIAYSHDDTNPVIPAQAGIQFLHTAHKWVLTRHSRAGRNPLSHYPAAREKYSVIPAKAGMTVGLKGRATDRLCSGVFCSLFLCLGGIWSNHDTTSCGAKPPGSRRTSRVKPAVAKVRTMEPDGLTAQDVVS